MLIFHIHFNSLQRFPNFCILKWVVYRKRIIRNSVNHLDEFFGPSDLHMHLREAPKKEMNIPQPRFLLRDPNDKKPTSIYCHLRFNNDRIVFATGEKIHQKEWDSEKQRAINSKKYPHNSDLNMWLEKIDTETKFIFRNFNLENITPNRDLVLKSINERLFQKSSKRIPTLLEFIGKYDKVGSSSHLGINS